MTPDERRIIGRLVRTVTRMVDEHQHRNTLEWGLLRQARMDLTAVETLLGGPVEDPAEDPDD